MELHALKHKSTNILAIGFEGERRGSLYVQFHDGHGKPTSRGCYLDVPRAMYNALCEDRKPGSFLNAQLKPRFEWVSESKPSTHQLSSEEQSELERIIANPDTTLPDMIFIPAHVPNTIEAIQECIDAQRVSPPVKKGLFD